MPAWTRQPIPGAGHVPLAQVFAPPFNASFWGFLVAKLSPPEPPHQQRRLKTEDSAAPVGTGEHLLFDDHYFQQRKSLHFAMHQPRKTYELAVTATKPWEMALGGYASIVQAGPSDFRIYYDAMGAAAPNTVGHAWRVFCVAISKDGKSNWTKPNLGLHQFAGSTANNIVIGGSSSQVSPGSVFLDTNPKTAASERFKLNALVPILYQRLSFD